VASNKALYGVIGALGVAVVGIVGGGLYIAHKEGAFDGSTKTAAVTAPPPAPAVTPPPPPPAPTPPAPAPAATPAPTPPVPKPPAAATAPPPSPGPSMAQLEQVRALVIDARRAIVRADFASADRALTQAERLDPRSTDVVAARRDLREAQERAARGDRRIDTLVAEARGAISRQDWGAADRLLIQAEQIDARDRGVQAARSELANARQGNRENRRIDMLVRNARMAIARQDLPEAGRLLDQAEQIDPVDRTVQQARGELNDARRQAGRDDRHLDALVAEARRAMARRDWVGADRTLTQAEQIDSRDRIVQQARAELRDALRRARGDDRRIDGLVAEARAAIARRDYVTADRLLDQAENIDARDRDVQQARAELRDAQRPGWGPGRR